MAYVGLARKWRPQTFEDLSGQQHIARTLVNAIKADRMSQGYLFTGTRGVGKTSSARIFAKAIRCQQAASPGLSCNQCQDCRDIAEGRSIDVLEIDGASNNGVDAVRELRDGAQFLPSTGRYKIYIIDEVHMLTTAAFNALLKVLEEPPAHLIFIFATTDPQKIPATVLSRCQRFDFKRVGYKELTGRLKFICEQEKISIDDEALAILTREAEGSLRDGVSLLDQVFAAAGNQIDARVLSEALGLIDKATLLETLRGLVQRDAVLALSAVDRVHLHGFDLRQFGRDLLRYLRSLMVLQLLKKTQTRSTGVLDVSDVDLADLAGIIDLRSNEELEIMFSMLHHGLDDVARSTQPKILLDILIMKLCAVGELLSIHGVRSAEELTPARRIVEATSPAPSRVQPVSSPLPPVGVPPSATIQKPLPTTFDQVFWQGLVKSVKSSKPLLGTLLENVTFEGGVPDGSNVVLTLGFSKDQSFYREQLQSPQYTALLMPLLKAYLGTGVQLVYKEVAQKKSIEAVEKERSISNLKRRQQAILESEAMRAAHEVLGGKLERLEIREGGMS